MEQDPKFLGGFDAGKVALDSLSNPWEDLATTIRTNNPRESDASSNIQTSMQDIDRLTSQANPYLYGKPIDPVKKPSFQEFNYNTEELYAPLSTGEKVKKFDTYTPFIDNNEYKAQNQSTTDKWVNGIEKFGVKTFNAVVGGTAGIIYGLGAAIGDKSFSSLYDNDFSNWLGDLDTKLNYKLPNYYTQQEQNAGVFGQMGYANFYADKFFGGLSFTTGAIISEAIWAYATGGTSLATAGARMVARGKWGLTALGEAGAVAGISKYKGLFKVLPGETLNAAKISKDWAIRAAKTGEVFSIAGKLARSAGYEASVEALQYKKEAEENFYRNFASLNGREPNEKDIEAFEINNEQAANAVFGGNMAILMPSNLVMLGHTFGIKNPIKTGISDFINRKAFGYGLDKTTGEVLKGTTSQKITRNIFDYGLKPGFTEGIFEEGGQGVVTKMANKWTEHTYDPKRTTETFSNMESFSGALADQYGSEEGWKDNMLGILIGIVGGSANVKGEQKQKQTELEYESAVAKTSDNKTLQSLIIPHRIQTANRIAGFSAEAKEEEAKGNITNAEIARKSAILSYINSKQVLGESNKDITQEMASALDSMTTEQWAEAGIEENQIEQEKTDRIQEFSDLTKEWKRNKEYWQYIIGKKLVGEQDLTSTALEQGLGSAFSKNAQIIEALTWQSTVGENSGKIMNDVLTQISNELGTEHSNTLTLISKVKELQGEQNKIIKSLQKEKTAYTKERDALVKKIAVLNSKPKETAPNTNQQTNYRAFELRLSEVNDRLSGIEQEAQAVADKINASETYKQNLEGVNLSGNLSGVTISGSDLLSLDENIKKFKAALEFQKTSNPQRGQYVDDLLSEYRGAEDIFMKSQVTQKVLSSSDFKMANIDGWISNKVKGKKAMNENTKEWLEDAIETYSKYKNTSLAEGLAKIRDAEAILEEESETNEVSEETLNSIADKVRKDEPLSKDEQTIKDNNEDAINELIKTKNITTQPKSTEEIIDDLEQERAEKLAQVQPIIETITTPTAPIIEQVVDVEAEQRLQEQKQKLENELESLSTNDTTTEVVEEGTQVTIPSKYSAKGNTFTFRNGTWQAQDSRKQWVNANQKEIEEIEAKINENPNQQRIEEINSELENVNSQLESLPTIENEIEQEPIVTENEVPNQKEIDKINKEYDSKIKNLKTTFTKTSTLEEYKKRVENLLKDVYRSLNYLPQDADSIITQKPTEQDFEEYRKMKEEGKVNTEEFKQLRQKLSDWKLLSTAIDEDYTSIADLLDLIEQLEKDVIEEETKDKVTDEDTFTNLAQDVDVEASGAMFKPELGVNVTAPSTVKFTDNGTIELTHIKAEYIVTQIGGNYTISRKGAKIDKLRVGDIVTIDGMAFKYLAGGRLEFTKKDDFLERQQQLNLYVRDTKTVGWSFIDVYSVLGQEEVKTPSQFEEELDAQKTYNLKKGDTLTLHVKDTDDWNSSTEGDSEERFKIFLRDKDGNDVSTLKAGQEGNSVNENFLNIRQEAYKRWTEAGKPASMDLGISVEVDGIFLGSAELLFSDGKLVEGNISQEAASRVVVAKGYILDGELTLDTEIKDVNTTFVGKLSKDNKGKKQPIIVFKKGEQFIAFPITMVKSKNPVEFDSMLQGTPQEIVLKINDAILKQGVKTPRLGFEDVQVDENGEVVLSDKAEKTREDFANKETFVTADTIADKKYKKEDLSRDATIRIDLDNLDRVLSSPKVRIKLDDTVVFKTVRNIKYNSMIDAENALNDLALELYQDYVRNASTKYLDANGDIIEDTTYTDTFDDSEIIQTNVQNLKIHNINILRQALSKKLPKALENAIGADKVKKAKDTLKYYDFVKAQTVVKPSTASSGAKNTCPG